MEHAKPHCQHNICGWSRASSFISAGCDSQHRMSSWTNEERIEMESKLGAGRWKSVLNSGGPGESTPFVAAALWISPWVASFLARHP
jgi:hypothetical protein